MPAPQKVTDPKRIVTDPEMLRELARQNIDKGYVEFWKDYRARHEGLSPYAKFYRDLKSGKQFMVVSGLPKLNAEGHPVEVGWLLAGNKYFSKANTFSAVVDRKQVKLGVGANSVTWQPQAFLDGVELLCGKASLLADDPDNENYQSNVLEWDYGVLKRRLRLIHGAILERWLVDDDPNGEIKIKHNHVGDLPLKLTGTVDAQGQFLKTIITQDEEIVPASSFDGVVYPVTIGASLTVYSTSSDGYIYASGNTDLDATHDNACGDNPPNCSVIATGDIIYVGCIWYAAKNRYDYYRSFLYFDTSALGSGATITDATLSLKGDAPYLEDDPQADLGIVEGVQSDPFTGADYQGHLNKTALGTVSYYDAGTWDTVNYNDKALNDTGRGWISKTGTTKFCMRVDGDIDKDTPTGLNVMFPWSNEKGSGYQPKLVITYTVPVAKTSSDSGSGSETLLSRACVLSEVGTGLESLGSRLLGAMEEGGGAETLLTRLLVSTETASGLDAGGLFFTSSDVGSGLDAILALEALLAGADSGSGIDTAFLIKVLLSTDSGLGTDAVAALLATIVTGELMVGSDCLVVKIESAPKGGGVRLPPGGKTSIPSRRVNL